MTAPYSAANLCQQLLATPIEQVYFFGGSREKRFGVHGDTTLKVWQFWLTLFEVGCPPLGYRIEKSEQTRYQLNFRSCHIAFYDTQGKKRRELLMKELPTDEFLPESWDPDHLYVWLPGCESSDMDKELGGEGETKYSQFKAFIERGGIGGGSCGAVYALSKERRYSFIPGSGQYVVKKNRDHLLPVVSQGPVFTPHKPVVCDDKPLSSFIHHAPTIDWSCGDCLGQQVQLLTSGGGHLLVEESLPLGDRATVVARYADQEAQGLIAAIIYSKVTEQGTYGGAFYASHCHGYDGGESIDPSAMRRYFPTNESRWEEIKERLAGSLEKRLAFYFLPIVEMWKKRGTLAT